MNDALPAIQFLHTDHLGSPVAATGSAGVVVGTQSFYPFGEVRTGTGIFDTERGFTGQIRDASTGLNFYNARYQDPVLGRFISPDSIVPDPANPAHFNRFSYVDNNPLTIIDPSGHSGCRVSSSDVLTGTLSGGCGWVGPVGGAIGVAIALYWVEDALDRTFSEFFGQSLFRSDEYQRELDRQQALDAANDEGLGGETASPDPFSNLDPENGSDDDIFGPSPYPRETFRGGKATTRVLEEDAVAYRYYDTPNGGNSRPLGRFLTNQKTVDSINSPEEARAALNLSVSGNQATDLARFIIPKGTRVYVGEVAGGRPGAIQIWIRDPSVLIPSP